MEEWHSLVRWAIVVLLLILILNFYTGRTYETGEGLFDMLKSATSPAKACTIGPFSGQTKEYFTKEFTLVADGKNWERILDLYSGLNACFGVEQSYTWIEGSSGTPRDIVLKSAALHLGIPLFPQAELADAQNYVRRGERFSQVLSTEEFTPYKGNLEFARHYLQCKTELGLIERYVSQNTPASLALAKLKLLKITTGVQNIEPQCTAYLPELAPASPFMDAFDKKLDLLTESDRKTYDTSIGAYLCQNARTATGDEAEILQWLVRNDQRAKC